MRHPATRIAPLLLFIGCSDAGVTKHNALPTASITSHGGGESVFEGNVVDLRGTVGDPDSDPTDPLSPGPSTERPFAARKPPTPLAQPPAARLSSPPVVWSPWKS
jgi:hypothetical protein